MDGMDELYALTANEAARRIAAGELTAADLVGSCLERIAGQDSRILAWEHIDPAGAMAQARAADERRRSGRGGGPLWGIPVGIKDIFNTRDMPTCMGSPIFAGFEPGNDARVVFYLRQAGATIPGKTVTAEFAVHALDKTRNPHDPRHSPGTSSSGSAAAVAAGMVPVALGTQTAGSIVRPASYCGVYGCKPSFGLVPRTGMLKTTDTLDQVGFFARSVADLELLFDVVRVHGRDFPLSDAALNDVSRQSVAGRALRVGIVSSSLWVWHQAAPYARNALEAFAVAVGEQAEVEEVRLPERFNGAHDLHARIYNKTLAYYFREEFEQNQLISEVLNEMIVAGQRVTLEQYRQALDGQAALARELESIFERYDVLLSLSTAGAAPPWGEADIPDTALVWSLCGVPVVSAPAFTAPTGMPFGVQVVARRYNDYLLFAVLHLLEERGLIHDARLAEPARSLAAEHPVPA